MRCQTKDDSCGSLDTVTKQPPTKFKQWVLSWVCLLYLHVHILSIIISLFPYICRIFAADNRVIQVTEQIFLPTNTYCVQFFTSGILRLTKMQFGYLHLIV